MTNFQLIQGECLEEMAKLPAGCVGMILCDLPYGTTQNKWDSIICLESLWSAYRRLCEGAVALTGAQPFTSTLVLSNPAEFKHEWIWRKNSASGHLNAKRMPLREHESVLVFRGYSYNPQFAQGKPYKWSSKRSQKGCYGEHGDAEIVNTGTRYPRTILEFNIERGFHPTQKPVALMEYLIRTYTNEGDTVLDNTMGSGSTGVACMKTGRNFIGIERDPAYFEIARTRIEAARNGL